MKTSKRILYIKEKIYKENLDNIDFIIENIKKYSSKNFIESIDLSIILNIDLNIKQNILNKTVLPNGTGKEIKVGILALEKDNKYIINNADYIGMDDLIDNFLNKKIKLDVFLYTSDSFKILNEKINLLNKKKLVPNYKLETITNNSISESIKNIKYNTIFYKIDKNGIINTSIGKLNFSSNMIKENLIKLLKDIKNIKLKKTKSNYFKKIVISSTMGIGIEIPNEFTKIY
ncbi:50S ribosomal protein L1 [endosymbiont of Sipalinus gigas]|uniref:50S ribosomal protein L1 n=1 Tax=endosymbiont of Sipalinus gigas TaxID=1972134 RepID=UPI000DC6EA0F|nr:50S ribosomal protein L1 [endosymbiont of Sipalinus gigas]BBA85274.1 50S ribosomal protein L1 [endosymbiont of Sipalinus gigas]